MRFFMSLASAAALLTVQLAGAALAAPGDRMAEKNAGKARPAPQSMPQARPASAESSRSTSTGDRSAPKSFERPNPANYGARPAPVAADRNYGTNRPVNTKYNGNRPNGSNNRIVTGNTIVVPGNNRYPVYRPPGGGYYRPPNGGYYRPPPPPPGGWRGGYYPPPQYYYDDGPSVGDVIAGVAVTGTLLYVLGEATKPKQSTTTVVSGGPPPPMPAAPPPPPQPYVPPKNSTGAPALINVDIVGLASEARPSASVCITEAARQIGATGGTEIRVDRIVDVEKGNGGYRFRVNLLGIYPDETRSIPMYCRATPEKIIELTFG